MKGLCFSVMAISGNSILVKPDLSIRTQNLYYHQIVRLYRFYDQGPCCR